jgi:hypothetical protein
MYIIIFIKSTKHLSEKPSLSTSYLRSNNANNSLKIVIFPSSDKMGDAALA